MRCAGGEVKSSRLFFLCKYFQQAEEDPLGPTLFYLCAGVCIGSLFLRWQDAFRGFLLVCCPTRVIDDMPIGARIVQAQMLFVVAFVVAMVSSRFKRRIHINWLRSVLQRIQTAGAYYILLVVGFMEFYRFIRIYGFLKDYYAWPWSVTLAREAFKNLANPA